MRSYPPWAPASTPYYHCLKVKPHVQSQRGPDKKPRFVSGKQQCFVQLMVAFRKTRHLFAFFLSNSGFSARDAEHSFLFARHRVAEIH